MLVSPYIAAVLQDVQIWDKKLSALQELLEEWLNCQRRWMYLEPIFAAPDIQRQLPTENTLFVGVDRFWRDILKKVNANPLVMQWVSTPNLKAS